VPQKYLDQIDIDRIPEPRLHPDKGHPRHPWVQRHADFSNPDQELGSPQRRREALACYFALVNFVDEQLGLVLKTLKDAGLEDITRVIFSSDHGDNQGARGMWNKSTLYREATHVPMVVAGPGVPENHLCHTQVSLIDLAPTVLANAGLASDKDLPGRSLVEISRSPDDSQRLGFSEYHAVGSPSAAYMLRQDRWAYHHYVGYPAELFDVIEDPGQTTNLASDGAYMEVCDAFEKLLREQLDPESVDQQAKADQDRLVEKFGGRDKALKTGTPGASPVPVKAQ
jgi:choline-sulfatase